MNNIIIFVFLTFLDLLSKYLVKNNFNINQRVEINSYFDLIYIQNYGVSFGLLSGSVPYWLLILIGLIVVTLISYLMIVSKKKIERIAYFVIIIGAISNILDRFINTYVVDFILLHYKQFYWPAFNLADIYITIGIIMLIMSFFLKSEEQ